MRLTAFRTSTTDTLEIIPAPRSRRWMVETERSFANRCLPLLMANESGWLLLNRDSFTATWSGEPETGAITIVFDDQEASHRLGPLSRFGSGILSWPIPFLFRTEPGWELLVRGPPNLPKDGAGPLDGLVETGWAEVTFTMNWKLTRAGHPVHFATDEPFALLVPQRRDDLESVEPEIRNLREEPDLDGRVRAWGAERHDQQVRRFMAEHLPHLAAEVPDWDGSYMRGAGVEGEPAASHRVRRALRPFHRRPPRDST